MYKDKFYLFYIKFENVISRVPIKRKIPCITFSIIVYIFFLYAKCENKVRHGVSNARLFDKLFSSFWRIAESRESHQSVLSTSLYIPHRINTIYRMCLVYGRVKK